MFRKVGGPDGSEPWVQQQEPQPQQWAPVVPDEPVQDQDQDEPAPSTSLQEGASTHIETPVGKVIFDSWFGVISICLIIVVVGLVKKYLWGKKQQPH